ncbi:hypothetical protein WH43_13340 [Rheinheimera sp. KL1]|uniref:methyl-accepting chemotaxis protein n=1 Tax=Rheinheimera sp. KL1 TaxID=1635005 RepID=UPI0006A9C7EB|nr:PAS domain-containing methyl-accepting chemotaxis protein [Rheinheimera sp. KL1]KOO57682.1 hypothetical protein WH43_13340 [Rheinheimera sp. KL1]
MIFGRKTKELIESLATRVSLATADLSAIEHYLAVIEFSPEGYVLKSNALFNSMMRVQPESIIGQHHSKFCSKDYVNSREYSQFWLRLKQGDCFGGQFPRVRGDGQVAWLEATYFPVRNSDGIVEKVIKIASDVTASKIELDTKNAVFDAINRSMAVIHFDPQGNVLEANTNFQQVMGYNETELVGRHHRMFCDDEFYKDNPRFWTDLAAGKHCSGRYKRFAKNGQIVWIEATYNPIFDSSGNVVRVIKFASDVTVAVNKEHAVRHAADMAGNTSEETSVIVATGVEKLQETVSVTNAMVSKIGSAYQQAETLTSHAKNIGAIVSTIRSIAEQTNLLALNAAIEAARAGDLGRGFAVVADEVRSLASRTANSTSEIATVISATQQIVDSMMTVITDVNQSAQQVNERISEVEDVMSDIKAGADNVVSQISNVILTS